MESSVTLSSSSEKGSFDKKVKKEDTGKLTKNKVVEAKNQTSKGWFIVAIVIGSLVVVGVGGFGAVGLLQSHGLITLPSSFQWLASAIGTIGNTPHLWSLYAVTAGGVVIGGALIAFGSIKVHQARAQAAKYKEKPIVLAPKTDEAILKKLQEEKNKELEELTPTKYTVAFEEVIAKRTAQKLIDTHFSNDNLADHGDTAETYKTLKVKQCQTLHHGKWEQTENGKKFTPESRLDKNFIVIRTSEGEVQCTKRITQEVQNRMVLTLQFLGFTRVSLG